MDAEKTLERQILSCMLGYIRITTTHILSYRNRDVLKARGICLGRSGPFSNDALDISPCIIMMLRP